MAASRKITKLLKKVLPITTSEGSTLRSMNPSLGESSRSMGSTTSSSGSGARSSSRGLLELTLFEFRTQKLQGSNFLKDC